jgi:glutamate N-acetyltransferase/amino-acid N-acetyltransferase
MAKKNAKTDRIVMKPVLGGVTAAQGFFASALKAGIKTSGNLDAGLIVSKAECSAAGAFTTNKVRASSVDWCEGAMPGRSIRAVFCNSGNANACTGEQGATDTRTIACSVAATIDAAPKSVLVASTGVIGQFLPMNSVLSAIPGLSRALSATGGARFAQAIMTTDTRKKECAYEMSLGKGKYRIGGCAKGSGMIHPKMATMLAFITSDAKINAALLDQVVKGVVDRTFNNLTVDGDTSTNDMVLVLANGMSGVGIESSAQLAQFEGALFTVCNTLCRKIAEDGEGATKRVEVTVHGGKTYSDAKAAAKAVANSNLVKTALFGNDPNWGRILCAIGYSGADFSKEKLVVKLCGVPVCKNLRPVAFPLQRLREKLDRKVVAIDVDLGLGPHSAIAHTCDLTYDYIKINAEYHT